MQFGFEHELIARLLDFMLEKDSPLQNKYIKNKVKLGNDYNTLNFLPIVETVAYMVKHSTGFHFNY